MSAREVVLEPTALSFDEHRMIASRAKAWARRVIGWRRFFSRAAREQAYWARRRHLLYYREVLRLAREHEPSARSVLDVGSMNTPFILQFDWIPEKASLDLERRGSQAGVRSIKADFMHYDFGRVFDLVLCLQVLEHVSDPEPFARRLRECGRTVIVSVPYRWPKGLEPTHAHDPIDDDRLAAWLARPWLDRVVVAEHDGVERLIVVVEGASPSEADGRPRPAAAGDSPVG